MNNYYFSNCLLEAIKHFVKNPIKVRIKRKGQWKLIWKKHQFPHFYWYDKNEGLYKHFNAEFSDEPLLYQLWFSGKVTEFHFHK